ncbi:hypothetical protein HHK36_005131 [Tetracentron sinense]|uniref:Uncharacterized protein n=1 Tax=Tetracentron sinense TaxID=13715 RepID=A0A834ZKM2_TETSI|nr:hypothetical protein HHK36_005131 [Tetracentron sinense]
MSKKLDNDMKMPEVLDTVGATSICTITEFVARFDEAAKRRLNSMNQKLRDMERQMEALEAEIGKANASYQSDFS